MLLGKVTNEAGLAALKILLESMDRPRMMVLIREVDGKTAENAIIAFLKDKSFDLVDAAYHVSGKVAMSIAPDSEAAMLAGSL